MRRSLFSFSIGFLCFGGGGGLGLLLLMVLEVTDHFDGLPFLRIRRIIECKHNEMMLYKTGEAEIKFQKDIKAVWFCRSFNANNTNQF